MKRQYTRRTDTKRKPAVTKTQPLSPELEALAQVLAEYLRRANIDLIITEPPPQTKAASK